VRGHTFCAPMKFEAVEQALACVFASCDEGWAQNAIPGGYAMAEPSTKVGEEGVVSGEKIVYAAEFLYKSRTLHSCSGKRIVRVCHFVRCGKTQVIRCFET
jgi:hypothetical protein